MNDLFAQQSMCIDVLPYDGDVTYFGPLFDSEDADRYLQALLTDIDWQPDQAMIFGKCITTKRHVAWYADQPYTYTYSKIQKTAQPWLPVLLAIKHAVEHHIGETFNSCLLNLYHDGSEGMSWHSDGEKDLVERGTIASVSFGAERMFAFKHKVSKESHKLGLAPGSLLVMKGSTQQHWLHQLPPHQKSLHRAHQPNLSTNQNGLNSAP